MTTIYKYRIYCNDTNETTNYQYRWAETEPTTCPNNTAHSIDTTQTAIVQTNTPDEVKIKEETTPTGGNFRAYTMVINTTGSGTTSGTIDFPYPISALSAEFITEEIHRDDKVSLCVAPNTIIGSITANVTTDTAWVSQNYTDGDIVTYSSKVYTCTTTTPSAEIPTNKTYWQRGFEIPVSSTVTDNTKVGFNINLYTGPITEDVGRVVKVDATNGLIYTENAPSQGLYASTPTYVRQTVYQFKDYHIGPPWEHRIGESKIGGSYVSEETTIKVDYFTNDTTSKIFIGRVEYLY